MDYQWLSIVPPLVAIGLALITKRVIPSLAVGIISGAFIISEYNIAGTFIKPPVLCLRRLQTVGIIQFFCF
ncbi:hypothetical protein N752_02160 [Desulforamulus aquiferis]|nr:hypothetical protein [Desulforamulus aquiferis]RYD06827.1 hypothetical protein N752_02160 [Desulforamulus aquiferis]